MFGGDCSISPHGTMFHDMAPVATMPGKETIIGDPQSLCESMLREDQQR